MKYWKGKPGTKKEGYVGVMDNNGRVPDSIPATKSEYKQYINSQPKANPAKEIIEFEDVDTGKIYRLKQR